MTHGSLFSGIGGFELAADEMGWQNIFHCEINQFCKMVLKEHYPNAISYDDITTTDFTIHRGTIDILTGGFPCQPFSLAGNRKGTDDERHLWPEMLRAIREVQPRWIVGENVFGLVNWDGGVVFEQVQLDLEAEGYQVQAYILPAAGTNAPHKRYRVWFVAHAHHHGHQHGRPEENRQTPGKGKSKQDQRQRVWTETYGTGHPGFTTDTQRNGSHKRKSSRSSKQYNKNVEKRRVSSHSGGKKLFRLGNCRAIGKKETSKRPKKRVEPCSNIFTAWQNFPTQSPVCNGNDGLPTELVRQRIREDSMGYLSEKEIDKIISKAVTAWRIETIKTGGNAIVHQVALQIFKSIEAYEKLSSV